MSNAILSYYPTYAILDEVLTSGSYKNINFFFDLKNNLQSLYMKHEIENLIETTLLSKRTDSTIFESVLDFLAFHKTYAANRNINVKFYFFLESGKSNYHLNISKKYKISRRIDDLYGLDREKRELFFNIIQKNFMLLEKALNRMPNVHVIRLPYLEADFVPYYLISRKLVDMDETAQVIYSNDHDLLQCLITEDVYTFVKVPKVKKLVKKGQALKSYLKFSTDKYDEYLPLIMAIIGDTGDDVYGVKGIGGKTIEKIIDEVITLTGSVENLYSNVMDRKQIFSSDLENHPNKYINSIIEKERTENLITNNLKLVSFEILSRFLDNPVNTEMLEKRKIIENTLNNKEIVEMSKIKKALELARVYVNDDTLESIYYNGGSNQNAQF